MFLVSTSMSTHLSRSPDEPSSRAEHPPIGGRQTKWHHDDPAAFLDALGDDYTRAAFEAILGQPRSGREVAEVTTMSRSTAFRRLNTLVELGVARTEQSIDPSDGRHYKQYRTVIDTFSVSFDGDGLTVVLESAAEESSGPHAGVPRAIPADD